MLFVLIAVLRRMKNVEVKQHQNTKWIQAVDFQNDIKDPTKKVLQIDYAKAYQCELQNEIMSVSKR